MPPIKEIKTIEHIIFYQYAIIITKSVFNCVDGKEAKAKYFAFIKKTFNKLISGEMKWSDILREDWQFQEADKACFYCGAKENLQKDHIVPKSIKVKPDCKTCEHILGIHNQIWACKSCNGTGGKGAKGLYTFYKEQYPNEKKFQNIIPSLVEKKYLKTIYHCHECNGTLHNGDIDGDGDITVLDIDFVINSNT